MAPSSRIESRVAPKKVKTGIPELVSALANADSAVRTKARKALVAIGKLSVPSLIRLLSHRKPHVRWEAAKALCGIADPLAAAALVNALDDRDGDVRWLAAEGVAALGREGLQPLLAALLQRAESCWFCRRARTRVCHTLVKRKKLGPILLACIGGSERTRAGSCGASGRLCRGLSRLRELP